MHVDVFGHCSGVTRAVLASEAVHSELVAIGANVVRLHLQTEALGVVICAHLVEVEKHAGLRPVIDIFSVVTPALLLLVIVMVEVVPVVAPLSIDLVGAKASDERSNGILHVFVVSFEDFSFIL